MVMRASHLQGHQASITDFTRDDSALVLPLAKIDFGDRLAPGKSPQVLLLEANSLFTGRITKMFLKIYYFPQLWYQVRNVFIIPLSSRRAIGK
jgi:hypothetical protein